MSGDEVCRITVQKLGADDFYFRIGGRSFFVLGDADPFSSCGVRPNFSSRFREGDTLMADYDLLKQGLLTTVDSLKPLVREEQRQALDQIGTKLKEEAFNLVILGQFKRVKSTFTNALLGEDLLPTAIVFSPPESSPHSFVDISNSLGWDEVRRTNEYGSTPGHGESFDRCQQ